MSAVRGGEFISRGGVLLRQINNWELKLHLLWIWAFSCHELPRILNVGEWLVVWGQSPWNSVPTRNCLKHGVYFNCFFYLCSVLLSFKSVDKEYAFSVRDQHKLYFFFFFLSKFRTSIICRHCVMFQKAYLVLLQHSPESYNLLLWLQPCLHTKFTLPLRKLSMFGSHG